jgi:DNA invertase Pin-like site-specific DNA recombinase
LEDRDALKELIDDVQSGNAEYSTILVYDISRWGRFQDADESAYYEHICKRAGIQVRYRFEELDALFELAARSQLMEVHHGLGSIYRDHPGQCDRRR